MKQISGKDFCKLLQARGWKLKSISGSHRIFIKEGKRERIVVPTHANKPLKFGLLKAQIEDRGHPRKRTLMPSQR